MPPAVIVGAAVVGSAVAGGIAAKQKANAAGAALEDAYNQADAIGAKAQIRPEEIAALEANTRQREQVIAREQKLIEAVDPALMEAGRQAYGLLKGQESQVLGPIERQRTRQREQLRETLRRQMGPGFETSSAGIEALSRFDTQTSDVLANAQQNAIGQLLGSASSSAQIGRGSERAAIGEGLNVAQQYGNIFNRELQGRIRGSELIQGAQNQKIGAAGGVASAVSQGFGQVAGLAGLAGSGAFAGLAGKAAEAAAPQASTSFSSLQNRLPPGDQMTAENFPKGQFSNYA